MNYIALDLEATCWEYDTSVHEKEIIEIGAVLVDGHTLSRQEEFSQLVKPAEKPDISDYCRQLTGIQNEEIFSAAPFSEVWPEFLNWAGADEFTLVSWGNYDWYQLEIEAKRHNMPFPPVNCRGHINLKERFASVYSLKKPVGLKKGVRKIGLEFEGTNHRGLDDAKNVASILIHLLPVIRS